MDRDCDISRVPLRNGDRVCKTSTGQYYHWDYLRQWLQNNNTCPSSRVPIEWVREVPQHLVQNRDILQVADNHLLAGNLWEQPRIQPRGIQALIQMQQERRRIQQQHRRDRREGDRLYPARPQQRRNNAREEPNLPTPKQIFQCQIFVILIEGEEGQEGQEGKIRRRMIPVLLNRIY